MLFIFTLITQYSSLCTLWFYLFSNISDNPKSIVVISLNTDHQNVTVASFDQVLPSKIL